jgi:LmbE family N-acetylglucosaminyl deacetylase/glycosyltransferase involved in cell wall biosynthesis
MTTIPLPPDPLPAVPFHTTQLLNHRVLVLAPHPDDESLGCGGALILHARHGDPVKVVVLTDGVRGDVKRQHESGDYVALRRREARQACQGVLGVADLEFWEYEDGALVGAESAAARLNRLIADYRPSLVYVPSPQEFHLDHRAAALILWRAIQRLPHDFLIAFYEINRPIHVNTLVDISSVVDDKRRACDTYASQLVNFPYTDCTLGLNRYRALTVSPSCRFAEGYLVIPTNQLRDQSPDAFALGCLIPRMSTTESTPLVSIIVRTTGRPALLADALASLVTQQYVNLEVIVVNDGGEEITDVLAGFAHCLVIRHLRHDTRRGRAEAANSGLAAARGKYINFLDDDDRLYPDHVLKLVSYLESTGDLVAYSDCEKGWYEWVDGRWRLIGERAPFMGVDYDWNRLHVANYIPIMCPMFRRDLLERVEPIDTSLEFLEDWDFWLRMAACTSFQRLPGVTAEYRTFTTGNKFEYQRWYLAVCRKHESYWNLENIYALGSELATMTDKNQHLQQALGAEEALRLEAETRWRRAEAALTDAERTLGATEALRLEAETRWRRAEAALTDAERTLGATEALRLGAETRWRRAEAALTDAERSMPMRLSRFAHRFLPDRVVRRLRQWGRRVAPAKSRDAQQSPRAQ